jgi:hypothetical protein
MKSETPRTDALLQVYPGTSILLNQQADITAFARQLERENNELQSTINTLHNLCVSAERRAFSKLKEERCAAMPNIRS